MTISYTRKHIEGVPRVCLMLRIFDLNGVGADLGERVQHPLPAFIWNVEERDRMRRLGEHPGEDAAHVIEIRRFRLRRAYGGQAQNDPTVPGTAGSSAEAAPTWNRPSGHGRDRRLDRAGIGVDAADDVAVLVEREEELAAAAIDLEDTRAGTDIKGLGDVLRRVLSDRKATAKLAHYLSSEAMLMVAVSIATDATFVPAGTRNGNVHLYSGTEPGSMIDTDVL